MDRSRGQSVAAGLVPREFGRVDEWYVPSAPRRAQVTTDEPAGPAPMTTTSR